MKSQQQVAPVVSQRLERSENELRAVFVHADVERQSSNDLETETFIICKSGQTAQCWCQLLRQPWSLVAFARWSLMMRVVVNQGGHS